MESYLTHCQYVEIEGHNIVYHRHGVGESMFLIHGMATYSFIWRNLFPRLSKEFDVIALDLLGCGDSDKPLGEDYSLSAQAEVIRKFLDKLGIQKAYFIGHDIGGGIGQIFAVKYPDRLLKLVLINTVGYDYWPVQPITSMRIPIVRQFAMAALNFGLFRNLVELGVVHTEKVTDELMGLFRGPLKTKSGKNGFLHLASCLDNRQLMDIKDEIRHLEIPVMIIRGDADVYLSSEISKRLNHEIKNSKLEIIKTGGHFIQEDEPELLINLIIDFSRKILLSSSS
jgi:pimeloyl-ACP methyl ester carboxylesterase